MCEHSTHIYTYPVIMPPPLCLNQGQCPSILGTMSWLDMVQLLTTLTTVSRLMLAPRTWMWPCSIEMLVEVGTWAGRREAELLPCCPSFCIRLSRADYPWNDPSLPHPALVLLCSSQSQPSNSQLTLALYPGLSHSSPSALASFLALIVLLLPRPRPYLPPPHRPTPGADSDSDSDLSLEEERSLSIPSSESEDNGRSRGRFQRPLRRAAQSERLLTHPKGEGHQDSIIQTRQDRTCSPTGNPMGKLS